MDKERKETGTMESGVVAETDQTGEASTKQEKQNREEENEIGENVEKLEKRTDKNTEGEIREDTGEESEEESGKEITDELDDEITEDYVTEDEEEIDLSPTLKIIKVVLPVMAVIACLIVLGIITFWNKDSKTKNHGNIEEEQSENSTELSGDLFAKQDSKQELSEEQIKEETRVEEPEVSETPSEEESVEEELESAVSSENEEESLFQSMKFLEVDETVTAKEITNLRDIPSQEQGIIIHTLKNGETVKRTGIGDKGWSRVIYEGQTLYAVTSYLTDDLTVHEPKPDDGIKTPFTDCNDVVTAKIEVNLRSIPSVTNPESVVVVLLKNGESVTRTGINTDFGWSRVDYNGQTLYCVSSYLMVVE